MPKISVIIPVYNVEKYLRECLESVLSQTMTDIEIILLDDGGKDGCPAIIDEYAKKDGRIIAVHKQNGGYGQTCNTGFEKAAGEYIAIVESDDYILPEMFERLYNAAVLHNADVVKSPYYENYNFKKGGLQKCMLKNFIPEGQVFTLNDYPELLSVHPSIWTCLYKREFLQNNGITFIQAPGSGWTDNLFQVQTLCLAKRIVFVNEAFYYWRKTNFDASKDLKDFTVPFKRTKEIHDWINNNGFADENLLVNLFKRELSYCETVNKMINIKDIPQYLEILKDFYTVTGSDILISNPKITKKNIKFYNMLKNHPVWAILAKKAGFGGIKYRFSKNRESYIYMFGHIIWAKDRKARGKI